MRRRLAFVSLFGVGLALGLALVVSKLAARPLLAMAEGAERLARGDHQLELAPGVDDEVGALGRSLTMLAQQLERDRTRIAQLEEARREVFANVAHELRTPLTAIHGIAETLLEGEASPEQTRRFLEALGRQSTRLSALVSQLLRLAALEARAPDAVVREPVVVSALAAHVVTLARARREGPPREVVVHPVDGLIALGDPVAVEQILDNLRENALSHGGPQVSIEALREGERVVVRIVDDGPGIPADEHERIFERFYRARAATAPGTGLGLAVVRQLGRAMGGEVTLASEPGRMVFAVSLPGADDVVPG
jgi:signal transduction histidine kinase